VKDVVSQQEAQGAGVNYEWIWLSDVLYGWSDTRDLRRGIAEAI